MDTKRTPQRNNPVQPLMVMPLYRQLSRILESEITSGKWKQGDRIESEAALSARFSVSRITVRAALEDLVEAGLLARVQGKGTFVTKSTGKQMIKIGALSFTETCQQNGITPRRILLEKKLVPATDTDIVKLGLQQGDQVVHILRVLCADHTPVMLAHDHIRPEFSYLLESLGENDSLNEMMHREGVRAFHSMERTIELCMASAYEAEHLHVSAGAPMLLLRDLMADENGHPLRCTKEVLVGDLVRIEYNSKDK